MKYKTMTIKATEMAALRILRDEFMNRHVTAERKRKAQDTAERMAVTWELEKMKAQPMRRMK
jgi:hypothetical protein